MDDLRRSKTRGLGERNVSGNAGESRGKTRPTTEEEEDKGVREVQSIRARVDYEKAELTRQFQPDKTGRQTDNRSVSQQSVPRPVAQPVGKSVGGEVDR